MSATDTARAQVRAAADLARERARATGQDLRDLAGRQELPDLPDLPDLRDLPDLPDLEAVRSAAGALVAALRRSLRAAAHLPGFAGGFLTWLSSALLRASDLGSEAAERIGHDTPAVIARRRRGWLRDAGLVGAGALVGAVAGYAVASRRAAGSAPAAPQHAPVDVPVTRALAVRPSSPAPLRDDDLQYVDLAAPAGSPYGEEAAVIDAGRAGA
jgi:hypothetical protein